MVLSVLPARSGSGSGTSLLGAVCEATFASEGDAWQSS